CDTYARRKPLEIISTASPCHVLPHATPPSATYTLSLHDALPISALVGQLAAQFVHLALQAFETSVRPHAPLPQMFKQAQRGNDRSEEHTSELQSRENLVCRLLLEKKNKQRQSQLTSQHTHHLIDT